MTKKFGAKFRIIRNSKNLSIESLSDEFLSKSQISRFERGESEISLCKFINLITKLNMSISEFMNLFESSNKFYTIKDIVIYINHEISNERINNVICLLDDNGKYKLDKLEITMVKSILTNYDKTYKPSDKELLDLTDYLFSIDSWSYYEIILLGNCAPTLKYKSLYLLTIEMIKNFSKSNEENKKIVTQLAINCLIISIEKKEKENSLFLINLISQLIEPSFYYEKIVFLFSKGLFEMMTGNLEGIKKMKDAISIFEILEDDMHNKHFSNYLTDTLELVSKR